MHYSNYIEKILDKKTNLQLFVKVRRDWRDDRQQMKNFGYDVKSIRD